MTLLKLLLRDLNPMEPSMKNQVPQMIPPPPPPPKQPQQPK